MSRVAYPFGHFPFPALHQTPDAAHPLGLSLEEAMRWYWRIKTLQAKITFSGTFTEQQPLGPPATPGGPGTDTPFGFTATNTSAAQTWGAINYPLYSGAFGTPLTDETQLCVPSIISGFSPLTSTPVDPSTITCSPSDGVVSVSGGTQITTFGNIESYAPPLIYADGLYYPAVILGINLNISVNFPSEGTGLIFNVSGGIGTTDEGPFVGYRFLPGNINFLGHVVTGGFGAFSNDLADSYSFEGLSMNVEVTAAAYWPYTGDNGNALYDTATGAPL